MAINKYHLAVSNWQISKCLRRSHLAYFTVILLIFLTACTKQLHIAKVQPQSYNITGIEVAQNEEIATLIAPYKKEMEAEMNQVIGYTSEKLDVYQPESPLGNWVADVIHTKTEEFLGKPIDFAIQNYRGLRIPSLPEGGITRGNLYELMPFENRIVVLECKGSIVKHLLGHVTAKGGWPISKSLQYEVKDEEVENITILGKPINPDKIYLVAMPDYIANGGDRSTFLKELPRQELSQLIRDVLIEQIEELHKDNKKITAKIDGRIVIH